MSSAENGMISRREFVCQSGVLAGAALVGTQCLSAEPVAPSAGELASLVPGGPPRRIWAGPTSPSRCSRWGLPRAAVFRRRRSQNS